MIEVERGPEGVPFARHVTVRVGDGGPHAARRLRRELMMLVAEQPRALVCDLSAVPSVSSDLMEVLRAVARHQAEWPGTPAGIVSADPGLRHRLLRDVPASRLVVGVSRELVDRQLVSLTPAEHATTTLEPGLTAPRAARAFVARACLSWQARSVTGHACLVTSELVTNAVLHAHTSVELTVSHCPGRLRVAVQDGDEMRPSSAWSTVQEGVLPPTSGRGLLLVSSVCRAWGVYPTADEGKAVWAVLDDCSPAAESARGTSSRR
jgi:hypothetical protein